MSASTHKMKNKIQELKKRYKKWKYEGKKKKFIKKTKKFIRKKILNKKMLTKIFMGFMVVALVASYVLPYIVR